MSPLAIGSDTSSKNNRGVWGCVHRAVYTGGLTPNPVRSMILD